jgi:hypothetical protein
MQLSVRRWRGSGHILSALMAGALFVAGICTSALPTEAASTFADPGFEAQWHAGENIVPNFWGPLSTAKDGRQEFYADAPDKQRLVQYFDKGRMELVNGEVHNGLLATELITGRIQVGDNTFDAREPPAIPLAGDLDTPGPTYDTIHTSASALLSPASRATGSPIRTSVSASGDLSTGAAPSGAKAVASNGFDEPTKHNVAAPFADYRDRVGFLTIGYAISEPFWATVRVAGQPKNVLIQIFERRVLTYTPDNPDAFKVEMGNIGRHYYLWRYA